MKDSEHHRRTILLRTLTAVDERALGTKNIMVNLAEKLLSN